MFLFEYIQKEGSMLKKSFLLISLIFSFSIHCSESQAVEKLKKD